MGNFNNSLSISPLGQSGNKLSPHLQDQLPLWLKGEYKPMFWAKTDILENVKYKMRLVGE
jgi:acyl-homoserine lactone acylase PvdQ